ncbi:MAG: hypothetical protein ONB44_14540 [candidate division KSB1 bacterium]|nr:hypothetical protein [candidate division KSB1 bacterium]MDZ7303345.1 hypothetical protein [candidate division KSB1 bacterium]MDZ7310405.1 hypothetical protein [candidate division KSB1 bacterium]
MPVQVGQIVDRKELKAFIYLPAAIHRNHALWAPPIYQEEWRFFNPQKNRAFSYCDATLALARRDHEPVGRIMGIINRRHNEITNQKTARFGYLECLEDQEIIHALLNYVEAWARDKGMNKIVGPMGFTDQDPEGFMIEGFEHGPTIATYYNTPSFIHLLEAEDYTKEVDYVVYKIKVPDRIPEFYEKIYRRISKQQEFTLVEFSRRKELKAYIRPVLGLLNETFEHIYGFAPLDEKEMENLASQYLPVLDPRFVKVVKRDHQVIAFIIGIPNMIDGIRKAKGRLFPFGIFQIIRATKKTKQLDLLLGGIKQEYRGRGLDVLMGRAMLKSAMQAGFEYMDSHHELETNTSIRAEMERAGGQVYKRYRIFQKSL